MIEIRKRATIRRTVEPADYRGRRLVVALEPGDVIAFREERTRTWFRAPIAKVYRTVVGWNVEAARAAKKGRRPCAR
jgi:hypothetical protein